MGNCWARFEEWLCPNPWSGLVIDKIDYRYTVRSVSLDEVYNSVMAAPATPALSTTGTNARSSIQAVPLARVPILGQLPATDVSQQQQQQQQQQPLLKTQPLPSPTLSPITPPLKAMEEMAIAPASHYEQKTPLLTAAQPKHYNSVSSSPLILSGKPAVPPPPAFSLLNITMHKPIHIEY
jgi:hypothetical protein